MDIQPARCLWQSGKSFSGSGVVVSSIAVGVLATFLAHSGPPISLLLLECSHTSCVSSSSTSSFLVALVNAFTIHISYAKKSRYEENPYLLSSNDFSPGSSSAPDSDYWSLEIYSSPRPFPTALKIWWTVSLTIFQVNCRYQYLKILGNVQK